jgi:hypothetical protein
MASFEVNEVKPGLNFNNVGIGLKVGKFTIANVNDDVLDDKKNAYGNNIQLTLLLGQQGIEKTKNIFIAGKFYQDKNGVDNLPIVFKDLCSAAGVKKVLTNNDGSLTKDTINQFIGKEIQVLEYRSGNYTGQQGNEMPSFATFRTVFRENETVDNILKKFNSNINYLPKAKPFTPEMEEMVNSKTPIDTNVPDDNDGVPF